MPSWGRLNLWQAKLKPLAARQFIARFYAVAQNFIVPSFSLSIKPKTCLKS